MNPARSRSAVWVGVLALTFVTASHACGACAEDKIAATYDHATIERAAARGDVMVFCEINGPLAARPLKVATRNVHGIDAPSVRISAQPAAFSFALDPRVKSPQAAIAAVQAGLPRDAQLTTLRLARAGPAPRIP